MISPYWSFTLAGIGIFGLWLAGRKDRRGWAVGIFAQVLWLWYAISTRQWGFVLSCIGYGSVYLKNWLAWRRDSMASSPEPSTKDLLAGNALRRGRWR